VTPEQTRNAANSDASTPAAAPKPPGSARYGVGAGETRVITDHDAGDEHRDRARTETTPEGLRQMIQRTRDSAGTETTTFVASCGGKDTAADLAPWRMGGLIRLDAVEAAVRRSVAFPITTAAIGDGIVVAVMTELRKAAP